jgi:hypothetical protein
MFISFSKVLGKVGGFHIGFRKKITSKNVLWASLLYLTVVMFQLMWYSALLVGWLIYAFFYGVVLGTKKLFNILSGQLGKLKATIILAVVYTGIILILILASSPTKESTTETIPTAPPATSTQPTVEEATTQSTTEVTTEATTEATEATTEATEAPVTNDENKTDYVLNMNSRKFHYSWCSSANQIKESNKAFFTGTRDEVIQMGYSSCGRCSP